MSEYSKLLKQAKRMGHKLTPELRSELRIMALVSDDEIMDAREQFVIEKLAAEFQVSKALMEVKLGKDFLC